MRMRTILPAIIVSALPATAADYSACFSAVDSMRCIIETAEFARERNAEIDASIARVTQSRAKAARNRDKSAAADATTDAHRKHRFEEEQNRLASASVARVHAERERAFVRQQNALANLSVARVKAERQRRVAYNHRPCEGAADARSRCVAEYQRNFARQQNALARASAGRVAAERQRAFEGARNLEIEASIARVANVRSAEYAAATTHCKGGSTTPRCEAERGREYAQATTFCKSANDTSPRCAAEFARERNAEINASVARVAHARAAEYAFATTHCKGGSVTPRCKAEMSRAQVLASCKQANRASSGCDFSQIETASTASAGAATAGYSTSHCDKGPTPRCEAERAREFARARNAEVERSLAAVARERAARSARQELTHCKGGSTTPRCEAERARDFRAARNAEIDRSIAAVNRARAAAAATVNTTEVSPLETGALGSVMPSLNETMRSNVKTNKRPTAAAPCRSIGVPFSPLPFAKGAELDDTITAELDRVAAIALACPGVRVEIHGHSDDRGAVFTKRRMAEARAQVAVDYLIAAGVAPTRVVAIGRVSSEPRFPNTSEANRQRNRRIEIVIRDPGMQEAARRVMWDLAELLDPTYIPAVAGLSP